MATDRLPAPLDSHTQLNFQVCCKLLVFSLRVLPSGTEPKDGISQNFAIGPITGDFDPERTIVWPASSHDGCCRRPQFAEYVTIGVDKIPLFDGAIQRLQDLRDGG